MLLRSLAEPRRSLAIVTVVVAAFGGLAAWAWTTGGTFPSATVLAVPVVLLAGIATGTKGLRGWIYLAASWALGVVAYGAMPPIPA